MFPFPMYPEELYPAKLKPPRVIFDLDGVLTNPKNPALHIDYMNPDAFDECELAMIANEANYKLISLANMLASNNPSLQVVVVTARPERFRAATEQWLRSQRVKAYSVLMRPDDDTRSDHLVKETILDELLKHFSVWFAIDDRDSVVAMYRRRGIECLQNRFGNY